MQGDGELQDWLHQTGKDIGKMVGSHLKKAAKDKAVEPEEKNEPDVIPKTNQGGIDTQPSTKPVRHDIATPPVRGRRQERDHSRTPPAERFRDVVQEGGNVTPRS